MTAQTLLIICFLCKATLVASAWLKSHVQRDFPYLGASQVLLVLAPLSPLSFDLPGPGRGCVRVFETDLIILQMFHMVF
jgi:hypothetical protein